MSAHPNVIERLELLSRNQVDMGDLLPASAIEPENAVQAKKCGAK